MLRKRETSIVRAFFRVITTIILLLCIFMIGILVVSEYKEFKQIAHNIENKYVNDRKHEMMNEVNRAIDFIEYQKVRANNHVKEQLRQRIDEVYAIVENLYDTYNGRKSDAEIKRLIIDALSLIRFSEGNEGYFIVDTNGYLVMHPFMSDRVGQSVIDVTDKTGKKIFQDFLETALQKKEGGFDLYYWNKPNQSIPLSKIVYLKCFEPLGWVIVTGEYLYDVEIGLQHEVLHQFEHIRFGEEGYIQVFSFDGTVLLDPFKNFTLGENVLETTDANGSLFVQDILDSGLNPDGGFNTYMWNKTGTTEPRKRIVFSKTVDDWGWIITAGVFVDDMAQVIAQHRKAFERSLIKQLAWIVGLFLLFSTIGIVFTYTFTKALRREIPMFMTFFNHVVSQHQPIDEQALFIRELKILARAANAMCVELVESQQKIQRKTQELEHEILERKEVEEALRENQYLLRQVLDVNPNIIFVIGQNTQIILANKALAEFYATPVDDIEGKTQPELHHKLGMSTDELERWLADNSKVLETGMLIEFQEYGRNRAEQGAWYRTRKLPLILRDDRKAVLVVSENIDKIKQAEEALRQSEMQLRIILTSVPITIFATDSQGVFSLSEGKGLERVGLKQGENVGVSAFKLYGEMPFVEYTGAVIQGQDIVRRALAGETIFAQNELRGVILDNRIGPLRDTAGKVVGIVGVTIDITERKQAEEALRVSEEKFRSIYSQSPIAIELYDSDGLLIDTNPACLDLFGVMDAEAVKGFNLFEDPNVPEDAMQRLLAGEAVKYESEFNFELVKEMNLYETTRSGQCFIDCLITPWIVGAGAPSGFLVHIRDITERKRAEKQLRNSEARYRELFNNMSSGVAVYETVENGQDFVFKDFNRAGERIDQLNKDDLIGKSVLEIFPGIQKFGLFEVFQRVWQTGQPEYYPISVYQDERIMGWRENYVYKLPSGEIVAVYDDVTERKQAEQALRASERQYRLLIEHVTDGLGIIQDEQVVFVNNPMASMLGYTPEQLVGKVPVELFRGVYKHYFEIISEQLESRLVEPHWHVVEFAVTRDNREVWMEGCHSVILWEGESAILVTMRDITERKLREDEIEQERKQLRQENIRLRAAMKERYRFGDIIGKSLPMQQVYELILKASATDASVVIYGESGTGKDLLAQMIHQLSERQRKAFVPVNCGSIQETLFEREFFGHRKGTFTGALSDTPGFFDAAHQGTLFLDEVGELSLAMQAKLLRAIDDKGYTPVGAQTVKYADVRIIAATNRNLKDLVKQGLMRKDFFYRINVITIIVPPLRERREDIPLLTEHFLKQYGKSDTPQVLPGRIGELLYHHDWPGNIRQLQNVLQRYLTFKRLMFDDDIHEKELVERDTLVSNVIGHEQVGLREIMEDVEKKIIAEVLTQNHGNKSKTAKMLCIPRRTLSRKMEKYQIS